MSRWILGGLATALAAGVSVAQAPNQRVTSGYLTIRVILDGGGANAGGFAAGGAAPGAGGEGGDPRGGGVGPRGGGPGGPPRGGPGGGPGVGPRGGPGGGAPGAGGEGGGIGSPDGGGGVAPGGGGFAQAGSVSADPAKSIVVVVPFHNLKRENIYPPPGGRGNKAIDSITHKFGKTFLFQDRTSIQFYPTQGLTYESEVRRRHSEWMKNRVLSDGLRLCRDALTHGMLNEAFSYSRELANQVEIKKDVKPPTDVAEFVVAFKSFESSIDTPPPSTGRAALYQKRLQSEASTDSTHYTLLHPQDVPPAEVNRRLEMLEKNFKAFYLWHAMARKPLPLPDTRLIVILPKTASDVDRLRSGLDGSAVVSDATFARLHNLIVLSPERLDENSRAFQNLVAPLWREGYAREELLKGIAPKNVTTRTADDHARAMTLALVDKALEDEADFAALSREGTRQLYIASGQLSQNVILPEWVENGSSSLFQKPKGPLFTNEGTRKLMTVSLSAGYGSPNFHYRRYFQTMEKGGKLNPDRSELLMNTVMDRYFAAARTGDDADPALAPPRPGPGGLAPGGPPRGAVGPRGGPGGPGGPPRPGGGGAAGDGDGITEGGGPGANPNAPGGEQDPEAEKTKNKADLLIKAQTTSWALTYYLAQQKMPGLQEFYAQLRRMPRDLHLDEKTVLHTFCRSFNLLKGEEIDKVEFDRFAQGWIDYMKNAPFFHMDIPLNDPVGGGAGPGGFGPGGFGPGGPPGGGGGAGPGSPG